MAKVVTKSPLFSRHQGGRGIYPWDEWLDGQLRLLSFGEDFHIKVDVFIDVARKAARRRHCKITVRRNGPLAILMTAVRNHHPKKFKDT